MSERLRHAPRVLFAVAAGPRRGFGHLVRAGVLADGLGVARQIVLRGDADARLAALRFGWAVHEGRDVLKHLAPDLLIVDDPSPVETARWVRAARRLQIPVMSVHDGRSASADADLVVDGSVTARHADRAARLSGPSFALIRPVGARWHGHHAGAPASRRAEPRESRARVLIALGGGAHVRKLGAAIARALAPLAPSVDVDLAAGFVLDRALPALPARCRWVSAPDGLAASMAAASVVIVAGGISLTEACALGVPAVAVPVVRAQRPAITAAAAAGAVIGLTARDARRVPLEAASAAARVLASPMLAARLARHARRLVDGQGTARVVARIRARFAIFPHREKGGWRHAA